MRKYKLCGMKKIMHILVFALCLLLFYPVLTYAQLTEGKYRIFNVKGFMSGKTIYENTFPDSVAIVRVLPDIINFSIAGYAALTYSIKDQPIFSEENYVYRALEIQSKREIPIIFKPMNEYPGLDGGILIVKRSDEYADIFSIYKMDN